MMDKRAAIYVRTSSERQAEKASPKAQEADCEEFCSREGYEVFKVYRDIQRYKVGRRLVEPSGSRRDRPAFKQMMVDAENGLFDIIVSWREDRLYRDLRPMLDIIDCIDENEIDIELVKENFDRNMAGIKASIARMELEAKEERTKMGMWARLEQGKVWANVPFGYSKDGDIAIENPDESEWVKNIWKWYADGIQTREIRRILISSNAQQRNNGNGRVPWRLSIIYRILNNDSYHDGIQKIKWDNKSFEIPLPILIDKETARRVRVLMEKNRNHPARHVKHDYLAMGIVYCQSCGIKLQPKTYTKRSNGRPRKTPCGSYRCPNYSLGYQQPDCIKTIGVKKCDEELWRKVWGLIAEPGRFENLLQARIEQLQDEEVDAGAECERLERELDDLEMERQKVITWARKMFITEGDLQTQLAGLTLQENILRKELDSSRLLVGNRIDRFLELSRVYRKQVKAGMEAINEIPSNKDQAKRQFNFRRKIIDAIVNRVDVTPDKYVKVHFDFNLTELAEIKSTTS